jgi:quercetin dioxygenase-like cupin family protein
MKIASLSELIQYDDAKPVVSVLMETENSKEIRILLKRGQQMKEHHTSFPIVVEIFEGHIEFGVNGEKHNLLKGDMIALEGGVPHDLIGLSDSIIRLSLSKKDHVERVKDLVD